MTDDLSEKLSGILSDPEAMRDIAALASQLGVDASGLHTQESQPPPKPQSDPASLLGNLSGSDDTVKQLMALAPMLGSLKQDDDTTRLLDAIRPFLSEERRIKLDKAKRLIKVMKLMPLLKDLPLFDL
ncbi:MAG: hypothetical protein IJH40_05685 [Ruminococcus sp.]|uniref:hypothetical protein n=1 Tax=Ruminococcus sp. TaxID=41978 RepID=UPI00287347F5|nr:hypothetical protein [Ruminococcus sp.]MBQ3285115.1 hypothetical protein [Ruminococcus sp.]